jgi:hypothetical protein
MFQHNIATIGVRLMAIFVLLEAINLLPPWFSTLYVIKEDSFSNIIFLLGLFVIFFTFLVPFLLWKFASKIASSIVKKMPESKLEKIYEINANYQNMAIGTVGLLLFAFSFPDIIYLIAQIFDAIVKSNDSHRVARPDIVDFIPDILKLILSFLLIYRTTWVASVMNYFHKLKYR